MSDPQPPILTGQVLERARQRERLSVINAILSLVLSVVVLVVFIVSTASSALRDALGGGASLVSKALFVVIFDAAIGLIAFPLSVYFGYSVQKRFGLLKQNFGAWLWDYIKQFAVGLLMTSLLFTALYVVFASFERLWLPVSMAVIGVFFAVIVWLQPKLLRLQFKAQPMDNPELEARIKALFDRAGVKLSKVSRLMMGEKTKLMNAALIPDGFGTEVIVADTLLEKMDAESVDMVIAHELGHRVHRDIPKLLALNFAQFLVVLVISYALFQSLGMRFGLRGASDIATLPLFMLVFTVVSEVWSLLTNHLMRQAEFAADRFSLNITRNLPAFERAFRTLASENLSDPNPSAWVEFWLHNHPSIERRLAAARALMSPSGDGLGRAEP